MNPESLLSRLKRGEHPATAEIESVRRTLADTETQEDRYTLIHVLWKAADRYSRDLIAAHTADFDEMVRRIALQALTDLSPTEEVFDWALRMVADPSKYVRMVAAHSIGTLGSLLPQRASEAARFLLDNLEKRQSTGSAEWESFYEGLLDLVGIPQHKRPPATRDLRISDIDPDVIAIARSLARGG